MALRKNIDTLCSLQGFRPQGKSRRQMWRNKDHVPIEGTCASWNEAACTWLSAAKRNQSKIEEWGYSSYVELIAFLTSRVSSNCWYARNAHRASGGDKKLVCGCFLYSATALCSMRLVVRNPRSHSPWFYPIEVWVICPNSNSFLLPSPGYFPCLLWCFDLKKCLSSSFSFLFFPFPPPPPLSSVFFSFSPIFGFLKRVRQHRLQAVLLVSGHTRTIDIIVWFL